MKTISYDDFVAGLSDPDVDIDWLVEINERDYCHHECRVVTQGVIFITVEFTIPSSNSILTMKTGFDWKAIEENETIKDTVNAIKDVSFDVNDYCGEVWGRNFEVEESCEWDEGITYSNLADDELKQIVVAILLKGDDWSFGLAENWVKDEYIELVREFIER